MHALLHQTLIRQAPCLFYLQIMKPSGQHAIQRLRMGYSELLVSIDPVTHRLLKYHEFGDAQRSAASVKLDTAFFSERDCVQVGGCSQGRLWAESYCLLCSFTRSAIHSTQQPASARQNIQKA